MDYARIINIVNELNSRSLVIIDKISQEDIEVYNFIQEQYEKTKGNVTNNYLFQFAFRKYYFGPNERFYKKKFFNSYFSIFSDKRIQKRVANGIEVPNVIEEIMDKLFPYNQKLEISYTTKLIHTINSEYPIYDSNVIKALKLKLTYNSDLNFRKKQYLGRYQEILKMFKYLLQKELLNDLIDKISEERDVSKLNEIKILDFLFWSAGKKV